MKKINLNVIYEDNHIIVCFKPEGVLSQEDITKDYDMLSIVKEYIKEKYNKPGNVYVGLLHRLDRRVSGVMVFAKTSKAASRLSMCIRNHTFTKKYQAIVLGYLEGSDVLINKLSKDDLTSVIDDEGKECKLEYNVIGHFEYANQTYSILDINLFTGRFNQIRKQLSLINYPLLNDFKYGYKSIKNNEKENKYDDHLGLCCQEISFPHPITNNVMHFVTPINDNDNWMKSMNVKINE